jgi:competence protein ComEC
MAAAQSRLLRLWGQEVDRLALWSPVLFGAGALAWLGPFAGVDPVPAVIVAATCAVLAFVCGRKAGRGSLLAAALALPLAAAAFAAAGFAAVAWRAEAVAAPVIGERSGVSEIEGWVTGFSRNENGLRAEIAVARLGERLPEETPRTVRIALRDEAVPAMGAAVACPAMLNPPPGPVAPGAYDFARRAWFEGLGGVGFVTGPCRVVELGPPPGLLGATLAIARARADASAAIQRAAPGRGGAFLAAVATGDRSALSTEDTEALQVSGLAHLVSVSGLHMVLVTGFVFAVIWRLAALIAPLALRVPPQKIAAAAAIAAGAAYAAFTGGDAPVTRAFVMASVAFGAVLIDRPAISLRGLALAAVLILAMTPEAVAEPGFQMSFAATLALVGAFEAVRETGWRLDGPMARASAWFGSTALTSLVAGLATLPFALHHFGRLAPWSLPANLAAAPLVSFITAPFAVIGAVLAPFGAGDWALGVAAWSLDRTLAIADLAAAAPGAGVAGPSVGASALALLTLGLLNLCLWRSRAGKAAGAAALVVGLVMVATARPADVWIAPDAAAIAARTDKGVGVCVSRRASFDARRLLGEASGRDADLDAAKAKAGRDAASCALRTPGGWIVLAADAEAAREACDSTALVLVPRDGVACGGPPELARGARRIGERWEILPPPGAPWTRGPNARQ